MRIALAQFNVSVGDIIDSLPQYDRLDQVLKGYVEDDK